MRVKSSGSVAFQQQSLRRSNPLEEATAGTGLAKRKAGREANGLRLSMAIEISGRQAPTGHYYRDSARSHSLATPAALQHGPEVRKRCYRKRQRGGALA